MSDVKLFAGDNRIALRRMIDEGVRVHSVVTDPPYGLVSIQKRFGKEGSAPARSEKNDGSFARLSGGFMGKQWDGTEIERDPEFWRLVYDVLLPGGYVFAFSGARTGHWQACAMETAGFVMHPMHGWVYGSGFPKAHNASKAIDKMLGTYDQRQVTNVRYEARRFAPGATVVNEGGYRKRTDADGNEQTFQATDEIGGSPEAREWDGWAYGTQAQKPALEPIFLGQKPFSEKTGAANLLKHGVGAVNIDGCRVGDSGATKRGGQAAYGRTADGKEDRSVNWARTGHEIVALDKGRYPANLLLDGSPEVEAMFPASAGQLAKARSGGDSKTTGIYGAMAREAEGSDPRGDTGSAARFFNSFPLTEEDYHAWVEAELVRQSDAPTLIYNQKANASDRAPQFCAQDEHGKPLDQHPTVKPIALLQHLIRHITPEGGTVLDPFGGTGTTAEAARREGVNCVLMEQEDAYVTFIEKRLGISGKRQSARIGSVQVLEISAPDLFWSPAAVHTPVANSHEMVE